ncbi:MAG: DNA polymerase III subunit epsilon [Gammaproteobacteria bacterium TMED34]|nr:MAG: DNA polymerase III subunit epsilon [Gammaproteobacteria bacterium TMED34]
MNEIFLDTETTGLSAKDGDRIVEIACVETKDLIPTNRVFHKLLNPQKKVSPEAFKVHGFSDDFLKDKEKFDDIVEDFLEFIKDKKLIIHNASFDIGFLNTELRRVNKKILDPKNVMDSLSLARSKFPASPNSLDNLCKRFNIDLSKRTKHNALLDCELLREVYINLVDQREPSLLFQQKEDQITDFEIDKSITNREKILVKIKPEESKRHIEFLKNELKKNFY